MELLLWLQLALLCLQLPLLRLHRACLLLHLSRLDMALLWRWWTSHLTNWSLQLLHLLRHSQLRNTLHLALCLRLLVYLSL